MLYFAYGSNMCTGRLRQRVPSADPVRVARLLNHSLRFHKRSRDGSAKADAFFTGEPENVVWGVVFDIDPADKLRLDEHEGLSHGYVERLITVIDLGEIRIQFSCMQPRAATSIELSGPIPGTGGSSSTAPASTPCR